MARGGGDEHIDYFTFCEGDKWRAWPFNLIAEIPNELILKDLHSIGMFEGVVTFNVFIRHTKRKIADPLILHSFKTSKGRIWDCLNGWREKPE